MTAAAMQAAPMTLTVLACGDCAGEILRAGGAYAPVAELPYGERCEVHPSHLPEMAATNAVIPPDGWAREQTSVEQAPTVDELPAVSFGSPTFTEITTRLVVAWTTGDQTADVATVAHAVHIARLILTATKGA